MSVKTVRLIPHHLCPMTLEMVASEDVISSDNRTGQVGDAIRSSGLRFTALGIDFV